MWLLLIFCILFSNVVSAINFDFNEKSIFPGLINTGSYWKGNDLCKMQNRLYQQELQNYTLWAYEMWDASVKYPVGVLRGNVFQMGSWDECLTINGPFPTRYCLTSLLIKLQKPEPTRDSFYFSSYEPVFNRIYKTKDPSRINRAVVHIGLCIPASCQPKDLEDALNEYLSNKEHLKDLNITYEAKVNENLCQLKEVNSSSDPLDIIFWYFTFVIIVLVISSTIYYNYSQDKNLSLEKNLMKARSTFYKLYTAFSLTNNFNDLLKTANTNSKLDVLYGLKVFAILVVITGHRVALTIPTPTINYDTIERQYHSAGAVLLFNEDLAVDTFLTISGLLATYMLLLQFDKKIINPFLIIFLRYIRLTPVYAFVILYYASVFNHTGNSPLWKLYVGSEVADCRHNWWTNLLYINNYVNVDHMCMVHTWYLPCDFHFYIMGIFLVLLINRRKLIGLSILLALFILSLIIPFALTTIYSRPPLLQFYPDVAKGFKVDPDFQFTYIKSHTRVAPYLVGMFAGYIHYKFKDTTKRLTKVASYSLTIISVVILVSSIAPSIVFNYPYSTYTALESGTYAAFRKVAWAVGTVGLLFTTSYGHSTLLKSVLSWSVWIPLGKLVYGTYLIHMSFQYISLAATATSKYFTYFELISSAVSDIVISFICGLFLYLGIEAPLRKIIKELLQSNIKVFEPHVEETSSKTPKINKEFNTQL